MPGAAIRSQGPRGNDGAVEVPRGQSALRDAAGRRCLADGLLRRIEPSMHLMSLQAPPTGGPTDRTVSHNSLNMRIQVMPASGRRIPAPASAVGAVHLDDLVRMR